MQSISTMGENETYNGMTYSQVLQEWLKWLHSGSARYEGYKGEICYLRGNVSYIYDPQTGERKQSDLFQNRTEQNQGDSGPFRGEVVYSDTAIFVPVISAFYSVTERYYGTPLDTFRQCQTLCRRDIDEGGRFWCTLRKRGCPEISLFDRVVRVETPSYSLTVPEDSQLKDRFEIPIVPGTYETCCVALVIIIRKLPCESGECEYRLRFGGDGRGTYRSDSAVDFIVSQDGQRIRKQTQDSSPPSRPELSSFD